MLLINLQAYSVLLGNNYNIYPLGEEILKALLFFNPAIFNGIRTGYHL